MLQPLTEYNVLSLQEALIAQGEPASRALKILRAFYRHKPFTPEELPISKALKKSLRELPPRPGALLKKVQSKDGTTKLLVGLSRGAVESVLMPSHKPMHAAACVSSQVGCAMGCDFCASTKQGFSRNLRASEIVEQFLLLREEAQAVGRTIKTLVFMGMGEPMHNLDQVIPAIERIASQDMGCLGWKSITVSTVGIIPGIERLSTLRPTVNLALSLHAPDDETRQRLVPMNKRYPVRDILEATKRYAEVTNTIATIEYCVLEGVNDSEEQALALAKLMEGFRAHVNLIPYNSIGAGLSGVVYRRPSYERLGRFMSILRREKVVAHFRETRGDDVSAACGQLANTSSVST
jgi:23S rRNA (adenine2503-C2)-methyltransferase